MTGTSDLDINRAIRRVLVKHWIDLGRVSVRCVRGKVLIYGHLQRIEGRLEPLGPPIVEQMFYAIRRTPGVRSLGAHIENWTNEGGRWRPVENKDATRRTPATRMKADGS